MTTNISNRVRGVLTVILATVCWSTSSILINLIYQNFSIPAVSLAFWRDFSTFSVLLLGILVFQPKLLKIKRPDLPWFMAMGAISIGLFHVTWNRSVVLLGASIATVMQSNAPIFVTIIAWLFLGEALTSRKILAVILAVTGTVLCAGIIDAGGQEITIPGLIIGLVGAIAYGTYPLFGKKLAGNYSQWTILFYIFTFGWLTLLPFQFSMQLPWPVPGTVLGFFTALILVSTIGGFGIFTIALKSIQASVASITATSEIIFAAILAYIILGERLDIWQILGAVLVISGVILVSLPNGKSKAKFSK
jgi:drug/metabolite transporter (DMT)-like permease